MSAHTPGPWMLNLHDRGANGASIIGANQCRVVSLPKSADRPYDRKLADAYLLAAAPDLLAAAKAALHDRMYADWPGIADLLIAAILKAEGQ